MYDISFLAGYIASASLIGGSLYWLLVKGLINRNARWLPVFLGTLLVFSLIIWFEYPNDAFKNSLFVLLYAIAFFGGIIGTIRYFYISLRDKRKQQITVIAELKTRNSKITKLYRYLVENSRVDTEYWYEGLSEVTSILSEFQEIDINELVVEIKNWEPTHLANISHAITADDGIGNPSVRSYIFGHIFLILNDDFILDIMDDFDYLKNSDSTIKPILADIKWKLRHFDFFNYDNVALTAYKELIDMLDARLKSE